MDEMKAYTNNDLAHVRTLVGIQKDGLDERLLATVDARDAEISRLTAERDEARAEVERLRGRKSCDNLVPTKNENGEWFCGQCGLFLRCGWPKAYRDEADGLVSERDRLRGLVREAIPLLLVLEDQKMFSGGSVLDSADILVAKLTRELGEEKGR